MIMGRIQIIGTKAKVTSWKRIPASAVGLKLAFSYEDPLWENLKRTVIFKGCVTRDVVDAGELVTIPAEVIAEPGVTLQVGVYGTDAAGGLAIPTFWADLGLIGPAADPSGDESTEESLPVWAQLQERMDALEESAAQAANAVLHSQQTLTPEQQTQARENIHAQKAEGTYQLVYTSTLEEELSDISISDLNLSSAFVEIAAAASADAFDADVSCYFLSGEEVMGDIPVVGAIVPEQETYFAFFAENSHGMLRIGAVGAAEYDTGVSPNCTLLPKLFAAAPITQIDLSTFGILPIGTVIRVYGVVNG